MKKMEATTTTRRSTETPVARAWNLAKKLDNSQKLELMTMLIDSVQATMTPLPTKRYTADEINAMIDQSERNIAEGRVYDFDEAMDELEKDLYTPEEAYELTMKEIKAIYNEKDAI